MNISFTGHRPNKLFGYDMNNHKYDSLCKIIKDYILRVIDESEEKEFTFYSGGALGVDQLAFDIVEEIKSVVDDSIKIVNILAIPFEKQYIKWKDESIQKWNQQKEKADKVVLVDTIEGYKNNKVSVGTYHASKMQLRNRYMVDQLIGTNDILIAVWDREKSGGTYNCVKYAMNKSVSISVINPTKI